MIIFNFKIEILILILISLIQINCISLLKENYKYNIRVPSIQSVVD